MTHQPLSPEEENVCKQMLLWIGTVRSDKTRGATYQNWVPSEIDMVKSSLFYRIRSGKNPLPEPPPTRYSYPWYEVVELEGPHACVEVHEMPNPLDPTEPPKHVLVNQAMFLIERRLGPKEFEVSDARGTSYSFRLWWDDDREDRVRKTGSWMIQNMEFAQRD